MCQYHSSLGVGVGPGVGKGIVATVKALLGLGEYQKFRSGSHTGVLANQLRVYVSKYHSSLGVGVGPGVGKCIVAAVKALCMCTVLTQGPNLLPVCRSQPLKFHEIPGGPVKFLL